MKYKIAFIGVGNMGRAILSGLMNTGEYKKNDIIIYDKNPEKIEDIDGVETASSVFEAVDGAKFVLICVKPQGLAELLEDIKKVNIKGKVFISIVAGITTDYICAVLGGAAVVRVMPNTPIIVGCGVSSLCRNGVVSDPDFDIAEKIFACGGITVRLPENKMNEIIALTSSSPAYTMLYIKSLEDGARKSGIGLPEQELKELACQSVIGAAKLYLQSEKTAEQLIREVTSPGGTTERAMNVFKNNGFENTVQTAMDECTKRAYELAEMLKSKK